MLIAHLGHEPRIHRTAYVAPTATVCGDVAIGAGTRVMHGASIVAEGGRIEIGDRCIVMENAVVRSTARHAARIGDHCLIGPHAHVVGCIVEDEVFIATGAAIFHGSRIGKGSEIRVHGVVHVTTVLPRGATVPIGWVAVGSPARILPPDRHDEIWEVQQPLDFPLVAYGLDRADVDMVKITNGLSEVLGSHEDDAIVGDSEDP